MLFKSFFSATINPLICHGFEYIIVIKFSQEVLAFIVSLMYSFNYVVYCIFDNFFFFSSWKSWLVPIALGIAATIVYRYFFLA